MLPSTAGRRLLLASTVTVLATGLAYYLQVVVSDVGAEDVYEILGVTLPARTTLLALGVLAAVVAVGLPLLLAYYEAERAEGAAVERQTLLTGAFMPSADVLDELASLPRTAASRAQRATLHGQAVTTVLAGLVNVLGDPSRVRACWYELETTSSGERTLSPKGHVGRPSRPSTAFADDGREPGLSTFAALDAGTARYWHKGMPGPQPPGYSRKKKYRAYISVPVVSTAGTLGMLTVDSTDPGGFRMAGVGPVTDVDLVELFARLLAASLKS